MNLCLTPIRVWQPHLTPSPAEMIGTVNFTEGLLFPHTPPLILPFSCDRSGIAEKQECRRQRRKKQRSPELRGLVGFEEVWRKNNVCGFPHEPPARAAESIRLWIIRLANQRQTKHWFLGGVLKTCASFPAHGSHLWSQTCVMDEGCEDQSRAAKQTPTTSQTPSDQKNNQRNDSNHHKLADHIHTH